MIYAQMNNQHPRPVASWGAGGALAPPVFGRYKCSKWRPIHRYQVPAFQQSWMDRFRAEFRFFQSMSICQEWFKILNIPYVFIFIGQSICEMKHLPNQNSKGPNVTFFHQDLSIVKNFVGCPSKWNLASFLDQSWLKVRNPQLLLSSRGSIEYYVEPNHAK